MNEFRYYYNKEADTMVIEVSSKDTKSVIKIESKNVQCDRTTRTVRYESGHPRLALKGMCQSVKIVDPEHVVIF